MGRSRARPNRRIQPADHRTARIGSSVLGRWWGVPDRVADGDRCWEDRRVKSRYRLALMLGCSCLAIAASGCSDAINAGPLQYVEADAMTKDLGNKANLKASRSSRPRCASRSPTCTVPTPSRSRSPTACRCSTAASTWPTTDRGRGDTRDQAASSRARAGMIPTASLRPAATPSTGATACTATASRAPATARPRRSSTRCPRDYRKGIFKFTSTPSGADPTATTSAGRSPTASTGRPCRPSSRC